MIAYLLSLCLAFSVAYGQTTAISLYGTPKYKPLFTHFDYVNPNAPVGGTLRIGVVGTFTTLNPFNLKGQAPEAVQLLCTERLFDRSGDEPFTLYARLAKYFTLSGDRRTLFITLNTQATFTNGTAIQAQDLYTTHIWLKTHGPPHLRSYHQAVSQAGIVCPDQVFFTFHQPLSQGQLMAFLHMPLLCHKQQSTFCDQTLTPLAATGPYTIQVNGQKIIYKRNPNYWGWHTPFGRGHYRFTKIIYSYFRDRTAAEYAAQSGHIDVWEHENIRHWPTTPGQKWHSHSLIRHVPNRHCMGMFGFIFNTRRSLFAQKPTRQALTDLMQQAFFSQTLFGPPFQPIDHFFAASKSIKTPSPSPHQRSEALSLLNKAGYYLKKGILRHASTHMPFQFDILFTRPEYQKLALVLKDNLKPYGITVTVKRLEALGYAQRRHKFDYDMIIEKWFQTRAPGFEQKLYWSATAATQPGSKNYAGIQDSVIDQQINSLLDSRTTKQMHHHLNKLDQRLKDGCYVIPLYRLPYDFLYHKKNLTAPTTPLTDGCAFNRWWVMLTWWQNNL